MKLKVWEEHDEPPAPVRLRLIREVDGVAVIVVAPDGTRAHSGHLLRFEEDGRVRRSDAISREYGFDLTPEGQITLK